MIQTRLKPYVLRVVRFAGRQPWAYRVSASVTRGYWLARGADRRIVAATKRSSGDANILQVYRICEWAHGLAKSTPLRESFDAFRLCPASAIKTASGYLSGRATGDAVARSHLGMLQAREGDVQLLATSYEGRIARELDRLVERGSHPEKTLPPTALNDLVLVVDVLTAAGIRPYLVSGTLLGLHRDGALLPWDFDHDVGVGPGVSVEAVFEVFADDRRFDTSKRGQCVTVRDLESGVSTDVFVHFERDGRYWKGTEIHEWWHAPFSTVERTYGAHTFLIPDDPERYLVENYGHDWPTPKPFYRTTFDTPNRVYRRTPEALMFLAELALESVRNDDRFAAEASIASLTETFDFTFDEVAHKSNQRDGAERSPGG